jgi:hypothetical protein
LIHFAERACPRACESDSVSFGCRKQAAGSTGSGLGMAAKDIGVKKYVIKLSEAERSRLQGALSDEFFYSRVNLFRN